MNALTTWNPLRELIESPSSLADPFENFRKALAEPEAWNPAVDISEDEAAFRISVDLPEVKKEDIHVSVDKGYLAISGERHHESEEKNPGKTYHRIERKHGRYLRRFALPDGVDEDQIEAKFDNGVLEVTIPKTESSSLPAGKEIEVS